MKKILVTGGAGFVGSNLVKKLNELGHDVSVLDNFFSGDENRKTNGVKYFKGHTRDIGEIFKNEKFDLIYHLGEYSRVEKSFEDPIGLVWDLNIAGTFSVLEFWKKTGAKLVYSGSSTKFAHSSDGEAGSTMSPYAWSKASNTELVKNYAKWFGLKYAITYFYNVYGEGEISEGPYSTIVGIFTKQYEKNLPFTVVKPGEQKRNFTHIDDIVDALVLVGEKGEGDEYGIGSAESFSVRDLAEMFKQKIIWMPERKGNRMSADVLTEKTKSLGWVQKRNLKNFIEEKIQKIQKGSQTDNKIKNKILVFTTTFYPEEGLCEKAILELVKKIPDMYFDVITTNIGVDENAKFPENLHVYRIGDGSLKDKNKLMKDGYNLTKLIDELDQELIKDSNKKKPRNSLMDIDAFYN
jgi:UDP-glucose 4-epimerase